MVVTCGSIIISGHIMGRDKSTAEIDLGHDSVIPSLSYQAKAHVAASARFHVTSVLNTFAKSSCPRFDLLLKFEVAKFDLLVGLTCIVIQKDRFVIFRSLSQWHAAVDTFVPDLIFLQRRNSRLRNFTSQ